MGDFLLISVICHKINSKWQLVTLSNILIREDTTLSKCKKFELHCSWALTKIFWKAERENLSLTNYKINDSYISFVTTGSWFFNYGSQRKFFGTTSCTFHDFAIKLFANEHNRVLILKRKSLRIYSVPLQCFQLSWFSWQMNLHRNSQKMKSKAFIIIFLL